MKKTIIVCVAVLVCISALIMIDKLETKKEYREQYFSNSKEFIEIKDILTKHYEQNEFSDELSYWFSGDSRKIFMHSKDNIVTQTIDNQALSHPLTEEESEKISKLLTGSYYECIDVNSHFVEFGNTTGSFTIYFSRTAEKPERISKRHSMVNMGDGGYCSRSTAR